MMESPVSARVDSLELKFYVSAFCSSPRPNRFEEMSLIKTLIDEDKIPLLKSVIVKVATISDTCERSPVFQKLAEKFGVLPRSPREVKPMIEISVTKQELPATQNVLKPDIVTTNVLNELPGNDEVKPNIVRNLLDVDQAVSSFPPEYILQNVDGPTLPVTPCSVISVHPILPSFIHHREVASDIKSEFEEDMPVTSVKLEEVGGQNSLKHQRDPLTTDISPPRSFVVVSNPTSFQVFDSPIISTLERTLFPNPCYDPISSWNLSPPTSPEVSSPSLLAKNSQPLIFARNSSPPTSPPYSSTQDATDAEPNQMLLVDPATFLPLDEDASSKRADDVLKSDQVVEDSIKKTTCHVDESPIIMGYCSQPQEKSQKKKHRAAEHWIVRDTSCANQLKSQFFCEVCLKTFVNQSAVVNHKRQGHKFAKKPRKTELAKDRLKNVIKQVKGILFACAHCERKCESKKRLKRHIERAHNVKSTVPCPENCGKMLCSQKAIKKHLLSHRPPSEWPVSCPLCDKRFQARGDIPKHLLTAKHNDGNLPEVGSAAWWALVYWDQPELIPKIGSKRNPGR